jgi:hypothetical protein
MEGILIFCHPELVQQMDIKVYVVRYIYIYICIHNVYVALLIFFARVALCVCMYVCFFVFSIFSFAILLSQMFVLIINTLIPSQLLGS